MTPRKPPRPGAVPRPRTGSPAFLTNEDLAARYGVAVDTIRTWRKQGQGPVATKLVSLVRYAIADVTSWENAGREDGPR